MYLEFYIYIPQNPNKCKRNIDKCVFDHQGACHTIYVNLNKVNIYFDRTYVMFLKFIFTVVKQRMQMYASPYQSTIICFREILRTCLMNTKQVQTPTAITTIANTEIPAVAIIITVNPLLHHHPLP